MKNDFTKYLKESYWYYSDLHFSIKYFPNHAFACNISSKLSGCFSLLSVLINQYLANPLLTPKYFSKVLHIQIGHISQETLTHEWVNLYKCSKCQSSSNKCYFLNSETINDTEENTGGYNSNKCITFTSATRII